VKLILYWVLYPLIRPFYLIFLILDTTILAIVIIVLSPMDRHGNVVHYIGKFWALLNIYLSGTRLRIRGKEKLEKNCNYIVMSNHQSLFDVWALIGLLPLQLRWVIKEEIRKVPIFGYALQRMRHVFVSRGEKRNTLRSLVQSVNRIKGNASIAIFPEGTRGTDGNLQRFHKGGAILSMKCGVPILPVTINGSRFVLPKKTLGLMPGKIEVVLADPIEPGSFEETAVDEVLGAVRSAIQRNLDPEYGSFT